MNGNSEPAATATSITRLRGALTAAGVPGERVTDYRGLTGGTFNAVFLVSLTGGERLVVKLPPGASVPLLSYEQGILGTEALYYQLAGRCLDVTMPAVLAYSADNADSGYLVMTHCPGVPWPELAPQPAGGERAELRAELGRQVASLHSITGPGFGYPAQPFGPLRASWRGAFLAMVDAVLADAQRFGVTLPRPVPEIRALFAGQGSVLEAVTTPVLTHFDLWDGNILVEAGQEGWRVSALIDAERAFWGDPMADFVSLALFGDIEQDAAFLRGYRDAGGVVSFSFAERQRISLYVAYLYLIMWVEAVPRRSSEERLRYLRGRVLRPLTETLDRWAAG